MYPPNTHLRGPVGDRRGSYLRIFLRQTYSLIVRKNWIVFANHWLVNLLRCVLFPIGFAFFIAYAQDFLIRSGNLGLGTAVPIYPLKDVFGGKLMWVDATGGGGSPSAVQIMSAMTDSFSPAQKAQVHSTSSKEDLIVACPSNFNGKSSCYAAIIFTAVPTPQNTSQPLQYSILSDPGLYHIDVKNHKGDVEKRLLPLQWAIDSTFIQLQTGVQVPVPRQQPFTHVTNEEERAKKRDSFLGVVDDILVIVFWLFFAGLLYHTAGGVALERATSLTTHLQAMGCLRPARYISWHLSVSLVYLPAWVIAASVWKHMIFVHTSTALLVGINVVTGFSLTSWGLLVVTPFAKSPQLAAIVTTVLSFVLAILAMTYVNSQGFALLFTILFPPSFFIFAIRSVCGWEKVSKSPIPGLEDPSWRHFVISSLIGAAVFSIFIHPLLAMWIERMLFDTKARRPGLFSRMFGRHTSEDSHNHGQVNAIEVRNLRKEFKSRTGRNIVTAIADLSISIPRNGIFVVLGPNGSGKSTLHGIISNIISPTSGSVTFAGGAAYPDRGDIGVVPQKNVLFPELTCRQTVRLWSDIKRPVGAELDDIDQLLLDCDLSSKVHAKSGSLSGGQKRKLQLAIGLVGGSSILLVDEATSGVDPLSRRSIWRTLSAVRTTRTVIFTTHFLDEADLLGDDICILAAPGKLLAHGPPVSLKAHLGSGYSVNVFLHEGISEKDGEPALRHIYDRIKSFSRDTKLHSVSSTHGIFSLLTSDTTLVSSILRMLEQEKSNGSSGIKGYDIHGATLEDVFIGLMKTELDEGAESVDFEKELLGGLGHRVSSDEVGLLGQPLDLANAKRVSPLTQALVIFRKRLLILKRSWLAPLLALVIACCGACISLTFMERRDERCELNEEQMGTWPASYHRAAGFLASFEPMQETVPVIDPPSLLDLVNASSIPFNSVAPGSSFEQEVEKRYRQLQYGGLSVDFATRESQVAYYAEIGQLMGPVFVNLASNVLLNSIQGKTGIRIIPEIGSFPSSFPVNTEKALKWIGFFVAALAVFPAFSILYVTKERASGVKSMHLSNGLTPLGLHLGHLLAELPLILITMTIIIIVFTTVAAPQFAAPGLLWLVLVLYGIAGTLLAFVGALLLSSPLIAFATYGAFSVVISILYISGYILTLTYANPLNSQYTTDVFHYTLSLLGPVPSMARAGLVSVNLFALLCDGLGSFSTASRSSMGQFGAPITYLVLYIVILFAALVWTDSGFPLPKFLRRRIPASPADINPDQRRGTDVAEEATRVATSNSDPLRVLNISKTYPGGLKAVDDVSFGVRGEFFSLLGPNGAGKTTTFNIISGNINPDTGNVFIRGSSIRQVPNEARVHLGLCPQFSAIDSEMTVREHLSVYGRLRGLSGNLLKQNIDTLLEAADLVSYSDRLASKLSGGNQRKLSLAIALMGNPSVLLIDEYSTGIDPSTKRKMWKTLKRVATGKAVVLTTHSMEEASALSQRVAIISGKMLAIGTVDSLVSRYPSYEIHFSCRSPEETARAQAAVSRFEGSRPAEDVATRWEVPLSNRTTLAGIFKELSEINDIPDFTIERLSLESVFLKTIRNSRAVSEEVEPKRKKILGVL